VNDIGSNLEVLTIGHSNHPIDEFLELLHSHDVTAVADVRSAPYSQYQPQFNREALAAELKRRGIAYSFMGKELGGRPADRACYQNGRVQYDRVAATASFRSGLDRIQAEAKIHRIILLCAEREPLECHRTLLVAPELEKTGISVVHVLAGGETETHSDAMSRLLEICRLPEEDLFRSRAEMIEEARYIQQERVAFVERPPTVNNERAAR
jgi:uncharacterized protein (DUF488 family)